MSHAIAAVDPGTRLRPELDGLAEAIRHSRTWHVVAAGKAAVPMLRACLDGLASRPASAVAIAPGPFEGLPAYVRTLAGGHPVPTAASADAGRCARQAAEAAAADDLFVLLLSGGASALMALPVDGVSLEDKQVTTTRLLRAGADIASLNAVRKHLSWLKGGRLAAATSARSLCLAMSDVVGDDPSVIGSGPMVPDATTFADALAVLEGRGGRQAYPPGVVAALEEGRHGRRPETPKPGSPAFARSVTRVIATRRDAMAGAAAHARQLGYETIVDDDPVVGEARVAARAFAERVQALAADRRAPFCVVSSGETTVTVTGHGRGGRNQEFALALVEALPAIGARAAAASVGTDGIDGPTDAAGGCVTSETAAEAAAGRIDVGTYLQNNDAYDCLSRLGALVVTGPTGTNVGDVQVAMVEPRAR